MKDILIREAQPEDAEKVIAFLRRIGGETDNLTFGAEGLLVTAEQERSYIQSVLKDPRSVVYCAWKAGELIGTGSITALPGRMAHRAELSIAVIRAEWGKGIGTMVMEKLTAFARSSGAEILNLEVRSDNKSAIRLYEKFGFRRIGTSPAFFKMDGQYIDFELMYLDLRQAESGFSFTI